MIVMRLIDTPPRFELRLNDPKVTGKSLLDLQLAPSSALHIKFSEESLNGTPYCTLVRILADGQHVESATRAPLRADLLDIAEDLPAPPSFDPTPEQIAAQEAARKSELEQQDKGKESTVGSNTSGNKVPKWLQKVTPGSGLIHPAEVYHRGSHLFLMLIGLLQKRIDPPDKSRAARTIRTLHDATSTSPQA